MAEKWFVLPCNGLDKAAGQVAREIALELVEGEENQAVMACPTFMRAVPSHYVADKKDSRWLVVDGCNTRCATKLATEMELNIAKRMNVSEVAQKKEVKIGKSLRLGAEEIRLAKEMASEALMAKKKESIGQNEGAASSNEGSVSSEKENFSGPFEYEEFFQDKFKFRVPKGDFYFNENDCWLFVQGNRARIGVTDYVQQSLSDIMFFSPPELDEEIDQFGTVGSLESTKAVFEVISPASGKVIAVNEELDTSPEFVNQNPYEEGWIAEIELKDFEEDRGLLLTAQEYLEYLKKKVADFHV